MKQLFPDPILGPSRFNRARLVSFRQFMRHDGWIQRRGLERLILQAHEKKGQTNEGIVCMCCIDVHRYYSLSVEVAAIAISRMPPASI
jgi:hypothetical protein